MSDTQTTPRKRTVKKAAAPPKEPGKVAPQIIDGKYYEPVYIFRYLFENGDVVDIHATRDDSNVRDALLKVRKVHSDRIVGSTRMEFLGYCSMDNYNRM
jgi:hypothetical protein